MEGWRSWVRRPEVWGPAGVGVLVLAALIFLLRPHPVRQAGAASPAVLPAQSPPTVAEQPTARVSETPAAPAPLSNRPDAEAPSVTVRTLPARPRNAPAPAVPPASGAPGMNQPAGSPTLAPDTAPTVPAPPE